MPLNVRLQLESLDGRWLPSTTTPTEPPNVPPEVAQDPDYLIVRSTIDSMLTQLHGICREYAEKKHAAEESDLRLEVLDAEIARRQAAGEDLGNLVMDRAFEVGFGNVAKAVMAAKAAAYETVVDDLKGVIAAAKEKWKDTVLSSSFDVTIPDLEHYYTTAIAEPDPVPLPPGVG